LFEEMLDRPDILYGESIRSNYQGQGLRLSKQFI
jgi:dCTP deaminase